MTMKKILYILILFAMFCYYPNDARAQLETDLARVNVTNILMVQPDALEFELRLYRTEENLWDKWANGTFQLELSSVVADTIDYSNLSIVLWNDSTDLTPIFVSAGDPWISMPDHEYHITPTIVADTFGAKISITIAGPELYDDCLFVPYELDDTTGILLGKFRVIANDGSSLPEDLTVNWIQPLDFYQACAYKRKKEDDDIPWHNYDPNLPMQDYNLGTNVKYTNDNYVDSCFIVKDFDGKYEGDFLVSLSWETECENRNMGFIITRGLRPLTATTIDDVPMTDTIAHFEHSPDEYTMLGGLGTEKPGQQYLFEFDTTERTGLDYCYKLLSKDFNGNIREHAYTCVFIPNTVISFAEAQPNPFKTQTLIKYRLEHKVRLTVTVRDVTGREVMKVYDNEIKESGWHNDFYFRPTDLAQQGLYDIIFIATPVEDINVELARAVVKAMYVK